MIFRILLVGFMLTALLSCGDSKFNIDEDKISLQIDKVYQDMTIAYRTNDVEKIQSLYHSDAYYLSPGHTIKKGHKEFLPEFAGMFNGSIRDKSKLDIRFEIEKRTFIEDEVHDLGVYTFIRTDSAGISRQNQGKFLTQLAKDQGQWKFKLDIYNNIAQPKR